MALTVTIRAHLDDASTPDFLRSVIGTAESLRELADEVLPGARTEVTVATAEHASWDPPLVPAQNSAPAGCTCR